MNIPEFFKFLSYKIRYPHDEWFEVYDPNGVKIGMAPRTVCHSRTFLIHKVVHILIFNDSGDLLLQKRSSNKDIQPDKWDTSVGGHMSPGENEISAAIRECREELGFEPVLAREHELYRYLMTSDREKEWVTTFRLITGQKDFHFDNQEISEIKFWSKQEIVNNLGKAVFTPNFEDEYRRYLSTIVQAPLKKE